MHDEPLNLDNMTPAEMDDCEILLQRAKLRYAIANDPAHVTPELALRYKALNAEIQNRCRTMWS